MKRYWYQKFYWFISKNLHLIGIISLNFEFPKKGSEAKYQKTNKRLILNQYSWHSCHIYLYPTQLQIVSNFSSLYQLQIAFYACIFFSYKSQVSLFFTHKPGSWNTWKQKKNVFLQNDTRNIWTIAFSVISFFYAPTLHKVVIKSSHSTKKFLILETFEKKIMQNVFAFIHFFSSWKFWGTLCVAALSLRGFVSIVHFEIVIVTSLLQLCKWYKSVPLSSA